MYIIGAMILSIVILLIASFIYFIFEAIDDFKKKRYRSMAVTIMFSTVIFTIVTSIIIEVLVAYSG